MDEPPADLAHAGYHALAAAEALLARAEDDLDPTAPRAAAQAALRALLESWEEVPRGDTVEELLAQAARTDETLAQFKLDASRLDEARGEPSDVERAKRLVDAARGRLANI
jgi:hypothetical protein